MAELETIYDAIVVDTHPRWCQRCARVGPSRTAVLILERGSNAALVAILSQMADMAAVPPGKGAFIRTADAPPLSDELTGPMYRRIASGACGLVSAGAAR